MNISFPHFIMIVFQSIGILWGFKTRNKGVVFDSCTSGSKELHSLPTTGIRCSPPHIDSNCVGEDSFSCV